MKILNKTILFALILTFLSGCQTIPKKFRRKREVKKEEAVYVDFKEYSQGSSSELYRDYYLFVDGWLDECIQSMGSIKNYKREKRALNEVMHNIEQISEIFNSQGKDRIKPIYDELYLINLGLVPNSNELLYLKFQRELKNLRRVFRRDFSYSKVSGFLSEG